jgi:hypothetical protein
MSLSTTHIMRIIFFLLVFQFISPAFLPVAQGFDSEQDKKPLCLKTEHSSILLPLLLKEKEENEHEESVISFSLNQLIIDFTDHSLALTELHASKYEPIHFGIRYDHQPPLFTLNCTFII